MTDGVGGTRADELLGVGQGDDTTSHTQSVVVHLTYIGDAVLIDLIPPSRLPPHPQRDCYPKLRKLTY